MRKIALCGGPRPYLEALAARLAASGDSAIEVCDTHEAAKFDAVVLYTDSADRWTQLTSVAAASVPVVAILPTLEFDNYVKALRSGAGVVHIDTSTEIICGVIFGAIRSEVIIPSRIASLLAANHQGVDHVRPLTTTERELAELLVAGNTVAQISTALSYSERTIRRKLQNLYIALGATRRDEAIRNWTRPR